MTVIQLEIPIESH